MTEEAAAKHGRESPGFSGILEASGDTELADGTEELEEAKKETSPR